MNLIFEECLRLLLQLHDLDKQGLNDSEEADRIRELIEVPFNKLIVRDKDIIQRVSASLYPKDNSHEEGCKCTGCNW
jgi:hypothetical protein